MTRKKYEYQSLLDFASALCVAAGLSKQQSLRQVATLVEADLMGHTTHGLNLLPNLLGELEAGILSRDGEPEVISDCGSALFWDGKMLAGGWLVSTAIEEACLRAAKWPV